ncbi:hypothetical protein SAY87_007454 [Trapa incisa]|uniref:Uncharacterized protein n=1 Tax=Trapa incisa TaxID=236973 RepID=A0AAN7QF09_9MYRT|nr:hypothetical protein SAY87_007454 [Trapa incisa]
MVADGVDAIKSNFACQLEPTMHGPHLMVNSSVGIAKGDGELECTNKEMEKQESCRWGCFLSRTK